MIRRKNDFFANDEGRGLKEIKRQSRRRSSAEEKSWIVLAGLQITNAAGLKHRLKNRTLLDAI